MLNYSRTPPHTTAIIFAISVRLNRPHTKWLKARGPPQNHLADHDDCAQFVAVIVPGPIHSSSILLNWRCLMMLLGPFRNAPAESITRL